MAVIAQFDFPAEGPWGEEMAQAYAGLAESIATEPGLRWKIWTENAETNMAGGIYLFDDMESAQAYAEMHTARLQGFGVTGIRALFFHVNETLTEMDGGPIS